MTGPRRSPWRSARLAVVAVAALVGGLLVPLAAPVAPAGADRGEGASDIAAAVDQQQRITVGGLHACAALDTGAVQCWGNNDQGQLGNGTRSVTSRPVAVSGLSAATSVAAGAQHTCAVVHGGGVRCWGLDGSGQLGDGDEIGATKLTPVAVRNPADTAPLTGATAVATGSFHSCALMGDGTVACWGLDGSGQLGDGDPGDVSFLPVPVAGITAANPAVAITAGEFHTCAALTDGTAVCWGHNGFGQLGDGTTIDRDEPTPVTGIDEDTDPVRAISAGSSHTCALLDSGKVLCWGLNNEGQLGDGSKTDRHGPVEADGLDDAVAVSGAVRHTCALRSGGKASCWGDNGRQQLGYQPAASPPAPTDERLKPHDVSGISGATAVTTGGFETCALAGSLYCWGYDFYGQLGGFVDSSAKPVTVTALTDAADATTGDGHACARLTPGTPVCWGDNGSGQLGRAVGANSPVPVPVEGAGPVAAVAAANRFTCLLPTSPGTPACFGANDDGQLGDGSVAAHTTPAPVSGIADATAVAAGGALGTAERGHACALVAGGAARCWGRNLDGQLGNDTTDDSSVPVPVSGLGGATRLAVGGFHTCAVVAGGKVNCWGDNSSGQLGDDSNDDRHTPVEVHDLTGAGDLSAGAGHTCAVVSPKVRCWGDNGDGQLGDGSTTDRDTPVDVDGIGALDPAVAVAAGDFHTCALLASSTIVCWGRNSDGQLGDGTFTDHDSPVMVDSGGKLDPPSGHQITTQISAGRTNTCARLIDTSVRCWGDNTHGQLGDGIDQSSLKPVLVGSLASTVGTNGLPEPVDDTATTAPLTAVDIDVLANDTDPDGEALTLAGVGTPAKGTAAIVSGQVRYTPGAAVCDSASTTYGTDSFTYTVTDGLAVVPATVAVTVTCPDRAPDAVDDSATAVEDTALDVDVLANDTDPDGDPLTIGPLGAPTSGTVAVVSGKVRYTPTSDTCGIDAFSYTADDGRGGTDTATVTVTVSCANDGPIAVDDVASTTEDTAVAIDVTANDTDSDPSDALDVTAVSDPVHGATVRNPDSTVTYTPDPGYCGADTFSYFVSDGTTVDSADVSVTVTCVPGGPNAVDDAASTSEDTPVVVDVLVNDTDPDGDALTVVAVTDPGHGTATFTAGSVTYTPDPDYCGADTFGYTVQDPGGATDSALVVPVEIACVQDVPVAVADSASVAEGASVAVPVLANDSDPDLDQLAVVGLTQPAHGTASLGSTGAVTYTPAPNYCGPDSFGYTVGDGHGNTAASTVSLTVTCLNDAPVVAPLAAASTPWGSALTGVTAAASDVDGDAVTWSLVGAPAGAGIDPSTGAVSWIPTAAQVGTHTITVRATDAGGLAGTAPLTVTVGRRATTLTYTGASTEQYSDQASTTATLTDTASSAGVAQKTVTITLAGASSSSTTSSSGATSGSIVVLTAPTATTLTVAFAGDAAYLPATATVPFTVVPESITTTLTGAFVTESASTSAPVALTASVVEQADGRLGSGLGGVQVTFAEPGAAAPLCTAMVNPAGNGSGTATCTTTMARGARAVMVTATSPLYSGPRDLSAVALGATTAGSASGAGRVVAGSARDDFAFTATPGGGKNPAAGSVVHLWRTTATTVTMVRSATVSAFSVSCTGGKTKVCSPSLTATGATSVTVDLLTGAVTAGAGPSTVAVSATVPDRYAVAVTGAVAYSLGTTANKATLTSGAIRTR